MFKFERFNFEVIIPHCAGFVNTETAFFVRRRDGGGEADVQRRGEGGAARQLSTGNLPDAKERCAETALHAFLICTVASAILLSVRRGFSYASVSRRLTAAVRVFLCRGALQESENMIYLLHGRTSCGGDMTDFRALPRDAEDGARYAASSPRGNARSRRSAFCGRVIFGGKI